MPWLSRVNFVSSDTLSFTDINNLGNDIRSWGDNVNGGGYTLSNIVLSASAGTMATVIGGTGTTSTLTLRSTSGVGTTGADIIFQAGNNGASEIMRLLNGGNVGIGTSSPSWQTTVYGSGQNTALLTDAGSKSASLFVGSSNGTTGAGGAVLLGGVVANGVKSHWAVKSLITSTTDNGTADLVFATRAATGDTSLTERMRIAFSGNVGIGTTGPDASLHVASATVNDDNGHIKYENTSTSTGNATNAQLIGKSKYGTAQMMVWENYGFRIGMRSTANSSVGDVIFTAGTDSEKMRILAGGNVGIGTSSPATSAKLEIAGTTGALLVPRLTTTERNALTAVNGMIIYNTTDNQMQGRINGAWVAM